MNSLSIRPDRPRRARGERQMAGVRAPAEPRIWIWNGRGETEYTVAEARRVLRDLQKALAAYSSETEEA